MVFSSFIFILVFLPIVFALNMLIKTEYSNVLLLLASLIFYAWGEPVYVLIMLATIIMNYTVALLIDKNGGRCKRFCLVIGIILNLGILVLFKYTNFLVSTINGVARDSVINVPNIALPIGISFFVFQAISYIVDVYRKEVEASKNFINVALYISFFPQLIAGPIVKYKDINKQIVDRKITELSVSAGFKRFIYGLSKKVLIANTLAICVDTIYNCEIEQVSGVMAWIGAVAYTFQIYYDFSGYSDMAIGLGKMFGFDISDNFKYPYLSKSISEFWRRWHISLGSWFREYLYIPLGGNRKGAIRTYINLSIVFLLTGLWHGANFTFIIWGIYNGVFIVVERLFLEKKLNKVKVLPVIYSFIIVTFGWVIFRSDNVLYAVQFMKRMLMPFLYKSGSLSFAYFMDNKTIFIGICAIAGMGFLTLLPKKLQQMWKDSVVEAIFCIGLFVLSLASIANNTYNPFIYFQF